MTSLPKGLQDRSIAPKLVGQKRHCLSQLHLFLLSLSLIWNNTSARFLDCPCGPPGLSSAICDQQCQVQQRQALVALYTAWAGEYWQEQDGWLSEQHHCQWKGVSCCPTTSNYLSTPQRSGTNDWQLVDLSGCCCESPGAVSALQLPSNNLTGQLSSLQGSAALASTLLVVNVQNNNLDGPIQGLEQCQQLRGVYLANNALQGNIPATISNLTNLQVLDVRHNMLTGSIPVFSMLELKQLQVLSVDENRLSGSVPLQLLLLPHIGRMTAGYNNLSGSLVLPQQPITNTTSQTTRCNDLNLEHNKITGTIPVELLELVGEILDLSSNALTGTLPPFKNHFIRTLRLADNSLSGILPQELGPWDMLELDLSNNKFAGTLPAVLEYLTDLVVLKIDGNEGIVGTVPQSLVLEAHLSVLDARGTSMQQPKYPVAGSNGSVMTAVPEWMQLVMVTTAGTAVLDSKTSDQEIRRSCPCPLVQARDAIVFLDPYYFQFEGCTCMPGDTVQMGHGQDGSIKNFSCNPTQAHKRIDVKTIINVFATLGFVLVVWLVVYGYLKLRGKPGVDGVMTVTKKRARPPQEGQPLTLVLTDVAGSTALWEWDTVHAAQAIDKHDKIMREYLSIFCGYEVTTEGDAFLVAFHEPGDATAYCLTVQIALQEAEWSDEVLSWCQQHLPSPDKPAHRSPASTISSPGAVSAVAAHGRRPWQDEPASTAAAARLQVVEEFCAKQAAGKQETDLHQLQGLLPPAEDVFRGLRVRMAVATGIADNVKQHRVTGRVEYWGQVMEKVQAMAEAPEGGQVLLDSETYRGINTRLPQKGARVIAALEAKGCRLPAQLRADPYRRGRRGHSSDSLERAIGATAAMAAATAVHFSQSGSASRLNPLRSQEGLWSYPQHGDATVAAQQPAVASSHSHLQAVQPRDRNSSAASYHSQMHDTVNSFPECWSTSTNAPTSSGRALCSTDGMYCSSRSEGFFACDTAPPKQVAPDSRQQETAAIGRHMTPSPLEQMSFTTLLATSGASFTAAAHAAKTVPATQSPLLNSSSRQPCSTWSLGGGKHGESRLASSPLGQPAAASMWLSNSLYAATSACKPQQLEVPPCRTSSSAGAGCPQSSAGSVCSAEDDETAEEPPLDFQQHHISSHLSDTGQSSLGVSSTPEIDNYTTSFYQTLVQHQLAFLGQHTSGNAEQQQEDEVPGQRSACDHSEGNELSGTSNVVPGEEEDDNKETHTEAVQLAMLKGKSRRQLTSSGGGASPLPVAAVATDTKQQQGGVLASLQVGLPSMTQGQRSYSAPLASASAAAGPSQQHTQDTSPLISRALAGSVAGTHSSPLAVSGNKSNLPWPTVSHLQASDGGSATSAWSDKLFAVVERVASTAYHRYHGSSSAPLKGEHSGRWLSRETSEHPHLHRQTPASSQQPGGTAVMVLDMGIHKLSGIVEPVQLVLALPPGLEARAHYFPPLSTRQQQTPGYLDAPAAAASPLTVEPRSSQSLAGFLTARHAGGMPVPRSICILPPVVMVFCAVDSYHEMLAFNRSAAEQMMQQYSDVIRWTLLVAGGYECQEQEGNYMIAFDAAGAALEWSLLVQEALLEVAWSKQVLALPHAGEAGTECVVFRGPRVRIGLYCGVPTRVVPHSTTGRADYFGPLVNRAARYCHTAAHAGQVVAPRDMVEELIHQWCGRHPTQLPEASGPPWKLVADPGLHDQGRACWARCPQPRVSSNAQGRERGSNPGTEPSMSFTGRGMSLPVAGKRALNRSDSSFYGSMRSRATLLEFSDMNRAPSKPGLSSLSSTAGSQTDRPGEGRNALKLAHTASMKRAVLIPQDCPSPHPVPDLSSLLTLRKVAADQLQQQQEQQADAKQAIAAPPAVAAGTSSAPVDPEGASAAKPKSPAATRLSVDVRRTVSTSTYGTRRLSCGFELDCCLAAALYARLVLHKWKWADTLLVHNIGEYTFKGINGSHSLVSISTKAVAGRSFPHRLRKAKGEQLTKGQGLLYELDMTSTAAHPAQQPVPLQQHLEPSYPEVQPSRLAAKHISKRRSLDHRNSTGSVANLLHTSPRFAHLQGIDIGLHRSKSEGGACMTGAQDSTAAGELLS